MVHKEQSESNSVIGPPGFEDELAVLNEFSIFINDVKDEIQEFDAKAEAEEAEMKTNQGSSS